MLGEAYLIRCLLSSFSGLKSEIGWISALCMLNLDFVLAVVSSLPLRILSGMKIYLWKFNVCSILCKSSFGMRARG